MSTLDHQTQKNQASGSPTPGEPEFLAVGKLLRPHGVRGEMRFAVWTDFPERLQPGVVVYIGKTYQPVHIKSLRGNNAEPLIAFDEFSDRDVIGQFRNQMVYVRTADLPPLQDGEIYLHQMIGLQVVLDEDDAFLGVIAEILETGANNVLVVRPENGSDMLIPDIDPVILKIDLEKGQVRIHLLPGLLPDFQESP